uniref:Uncharacterized protein n=1 Tax=Ditylenchus dipsaci TaxID=166011 RepID=A0A915DQA1_9BILA
MASTGSFFIARSQRSSASIQTIVDAEKPCQIADLFQGFLKDQHFLDEFLEPTAVDSKMKADVEIAEYLAGHPLKMSVDPFSYWQEKCFTWPNLVQLPRKYLCAPGGSMKANVCSLQRDIF